MSTHSSRPNLLGQTCYLELAQGFTYTLHVKPPPDGSQRAIPEALKDLPCPSYILSRHICCSSWKGVSHLLHAGELPGSPHCPLARRLLHVVFLKDPR
jgi:hypothetical protein